MKLNIVLILSAIIDLEVEKKRDSVIPNANL